jgi:uncharacterized protein
MEPRRFRALPRSKMAGLEVPVATGPAARLLGLAFVRRRRAGPGLLIPRCRSVHTFGMLFALDVVFLDRGGMPVCVRRVRPFRVASCKRAATVLELIPVPGGCSPAADG